MLGTPKEFNPYQTMVDLLLLEAQESNADQILLVSRPEHSNLYFMVEERVTRRIPLQGELAPDFIDQLARTQMTVSHQGFTRSVQMKLSQGSWGHCISLTIDKPSKTADIDRTIPIPALDLN